MQLPRQNNQSFNRKQEKRKSSWSTKKKKEKKEKDRTQNIENCKFIFPPQTDIDTREKRTELLVVVQTQTINKI